MAPECGKPTGSADEIKPTSVLGLIISQDNFQGEGLVDGVYKTEFGDYTAEELGEFGVDPRQWEFVGDSDQKTCEVTDEELGTGFDGDGQDDRTDAEKYREMFPDMDIPDDFSLDNMDWLFEKEDEEEVPTEEEEEEEPEVVDEEIYGCMDPGKENYNPLATKDDGSCILIGGCMTVGNDNYNPNADYHEEEMCAEAVDPNAPGTQTNPIIGCMDSRMDNYDPTATEEDPETIPLAGGGTISKSCLRTGCRDKKANNFDPIATADYTHKKCTYPEKEEEETEVVAGACPKLTDKGGFNATMPKNYEAFRKAGGGSRRKNWDKQAYCCVDNDGSNGNMKWKWVWNKAGKKIYVPAPTSLSTAKKYWRGDWFSAKCGIDYKKDEKLSIKTTGGSGRHTTAELCCVHWTAGHSYKTTDALHSVWGHLNTGGRNWSTFGYNWVILGGKNDGKVQQIGPEKSKKDRYYDGRVNGVGTFNARAININHVGGATCHPSKTHKSGDRVGIVKGYIEENGKYRPSFGTGPDAMNSGVPFGSKATGGSGKLGGKPGNMPSKKQMNTLMDMVDMYHIRYPKMKFFGHHQASAKECPGYNFGIFLDTIGNGYEKLAFRAAIGGGGGTGKGDDLWSTMTNCGKGCSYNKVLYRNDEALTDQSPVDETGTKEIYYNSKSLKRGFGPGTVYEKRAWAYASLFKGRTPPGGKCFFPGTKIAMANSRSKNIENIKEGDLVKAYDTNTNKIIKARVTKKLYSKNTGKYYIINNDLKVTGNHPFWVNNKWEEVSKLKIGDELLHLDGFKIAIKSIELKYDDDEFVHNFEVDEVHNYFAGSYLVHNKPHADNPRPTNDNDEDTSNKEEDEDIVKTSWKNMECDEFVAFIKGMSPGIRTGFMMSLNEEDSDLAIDKARECE